MRSPSRRRANPSYRPLLLPLEDRLTLGDGVFGMLTSLALLPTHAAPAAVDRAPQSSGEPGVLTPGSERANRGLTPPARPSEALVSAFAAKSPAALPAPTWDALPDLFAPAARRQHDLFSPSPQREQGLDASSLLALRAPEIAAPTGITSTPCTPGPTPRTDGSLLALLAGWQAPAPAATSNVTPTQHAQVKESFGKLPLTFEQNVGQTDASVQFFTRGPGYGLYLTSTEAVMVLQQPAGNDSDWRAGGVTDNSMGKDNDYLFKSKGTLA